MQPVAESYNEKFSDSIFFEKSQIRRGTRLIYVGRRNPNSFWIVNNIKTIRSLNKKKQEVTSLYAQTFNDVIELVHERSGQIIRRKFGSLCYSAIWRII